MDVEKTIQFILNEQAKTEVMRQKNEERWRQNEERWKKSDERFDKKVAAINKLIVTGMKMIARHDGQIQMLISQQARTDLVLRELAEAQKQTQGNLDRFIENFNRPGSNGKKNGRNRG